MYNIYKWKVTVKLSLSIIHLYDTSCSVVGLLAIHTFSAVNQIMRFNQPFISYRNEFCRIERKKRMASISLFTRSVQFVNHLNLSKNLYRYIWLIIYSLWSETLRMFNLSISLEYIARFFILSLFCPFQLLFCFASAQRSMLYECIYV